MQKYLLKHPLHSRGKKITCVNIRRAKVADLQEARYSENKLDNIIQLVSKLCNLPTPQVLELDQEDFSKITLLIIEHLCISHGGDSHFYQELWGPCIP
ncbi:hypothetical protein AVI51_11845 [Piscirickettsia salmonis]|uniref:Mu-like prophage FluMu gp41 family protein n=1 Tax=Piscirickettsia salmonis TaxID=1238 RepID=A0A095CPF9_PISSA|nr:phage tail assembly protein [Piscirickettsia salmonis]RNC78659.1 phage tail assembly protein [Piscirickettsiaceae bacterium NZ-RLO2]ALA26293.1 mu-like prophage FluMu gp41 family protein [Piscirickettsia salmonis]ALB21424.1 mu-like prophage FluMu gp41 family protein [Piscirickettsia salmonis]ALT18085.1 hypothetical protein PSLF89_03685 [Piscirickettsia salmonis LF-89 = ATCC VR-1361]ALY01656.1 hypothetical protein AWE47_01175 [Piscirickettsia salmonis]